MFSWREFAGAALLGVACAAPAQTTPYAGIGRAATAQEVAAWDIDVRPDFKGLPKGSGSVRAGMAIWEAQCASCHGVFGESNSVFSPIVGGTTRDDVKTGRVARLADASYPSRTTLMKLASLATLWDYIFRAMPWASPKSLAPDEVYAVLAYLLNLGDIVPDDFVLSDRTMAQAQALLPNRHGLMTDHALWPGARLQARSQSRPRSAAADTSATACMRNCAPEPTIASVFPDSARNLHGNLALQNRSVGAQRGVDTSAAQARAPTQAEALQREASAAPLQLLRQHSCVACHGFDAPLVGPSFRDIARRYASRADAAAYLAGRIKSGGSGTWGATPMPAQALNEPDANAISQWLAAGALQ